MKIEKWLLLPDTHRPYHNKKATKLVLNVAQEIGFDGLAILGDYGDCYGVSSHDKDPNVAMSFEDEIASVNEGLDEFDAIGFKKKKFIEGNHEDRVRRYLMQKAPELFNTVKIEELYDLKKRGYEFTRYKRHTTIGKLNLTHDTGTAGKFAHARSLADFQDNVVIGHTHRMGYIIEGNAKGVPHVGAMLGWLGDVDSIDYLHRIKALRDWALGFGVAYHEVSTGFVHVTPVPIIDYRVVVEGKLIKA